MSVCPENPLPPLSERLPLVTYTNRFLPAAETLWISPQVERITGHRLERWVGEPGFFESIIHPDDHAGVLEEMLASRDGIRPFSRDYRLLRPDGEVVWVHDESVPIVEGDGTPQFVQGYLIDITERKALERHLVQAQKAEALARLAAGIAHDFNNLLLAIKGYAELANGQLDGDSRAAGHLSSILETTERAGALTRQLLTFSRRQELEPQVVDLARTVSDLHPMLLHLAGGGVDLALDLDGAPAVLANPGQLQQVLMNLVANARDAGAAAISVGLSAADVERGREARQLGLAPGAYAVLTVADTGSGMDEETQARIFDPFFTTKARDRGTGLGLSLAQGIVRQSGGSIDVTSSAGAGTTFRILLPSAGIG